MSVKLILVASALSLCAPAAFAQAALTPAQSAKMEQYLAHARKAAVPAPVMAAPSAPVATPGDETVSTPTSHTLQDLMSLAAPSSVAPGVTAGISSGQATQVVFPSIPDLDRQAAAAITAAYQNKAAEPQALVAADAAADPALEERIQLAETVFHVDGTEAIIRHLVETEHMKLIIQEVANHIDIAKMRDTDKYRLAAIAAAAQTELEDRIIRLNATLEANALTKEELMQLVVAYNIDAQRKQTQMRLNDDGKMDRAAQLDISIAQYQIVKAFEADE